jgi:hypothetical protein
MTSAAVKSTVGDSAAAEPASKARLPAARESPRHASMIEPAEGAGTSAGLEVRRRAVKFRAAMESWTAAIEMVAIDERAAVRDVAVVVVHHPPLAPVGVPVAPSPTEPGEEADPETDSE